MKSDINSASMRADITSPGGTTASALYSLEKGGFRTVVADGLWSAYRRSLELGGKDSVVGPDRYKK
jgi:pyrroline-5-carboxylate reductase